MEYISAVQRLTGLCVHARSLQAEEGKANGAVSESDTESISEAGVTDIDRKQRDLENKRQQLLKEQKVADQEKLLQCISGNLGFHNGRPLTALIIFRSCLHWKSFQVRCCWQRSKEC